MTLLKSPLPAQGDHGAADQQEVTGEYTASLSLLFVFANGCFPGKVILYKSIK
jgi:hypothetical protein